MTIIPDDLLKDWTVLVVDDHPISLEVVTDILSYYGATVITATNGEDGLEKSQAHRPMFIITDISMPVLDGWGFVEHLKQDVQTRDIPVIALTAHASQSDRVLAMSKGFHNYISKPLDPFNFINQVIILLEDMPQFAYELGRRMRRS